jgi:excisionase family DNA binding protein
MDEAHIAANDNERLLEISEAAAMLGVCERTVRRHIREGHLPYIAMGGGRIRLRKKIHPTDLSAFIASRRRFDACQSTSQPKARTMLTTSKSVAFGSAVLQAALASETLRASKEIGKMSRGSKLKH